MPRRLTTLAAFAALLVAVLLAGCSSSSGSPASAVEQQAVSLTSLAGPGPGWSRVQTPLFGELIMGSVPATEAIDGVPVAFVYDDTGTVTYATSGWTRTVAPVDVAAGCREAQSWMATAEGTYGLVSGTADLVAMCTAFLVDAARESIVRPSPLAAECAPAVPGRPAICARVDSVATADGHQQLISTVSLQ
jgi:hypothetical protein